MFKNYMKAVKGLYGDEMPVIVPLKKRKKRINWEEIEQIKVANWLTSNSICFYHCPNGGSRNKLEAFKLKKMGVQSGIPDICIPIPSKGSNSLYIELKRVEGGIISPNQKYWLSALNSFGHKAVVCNGANEAIKTIKDYLNNDYDKK